MPSFELPPGYELYDPALRAAGPLSAHVGGDYKGATITQAHDARGVQYVGCCAKNPQGQFAFRVFRQVGGAFVEVPLPATAEGRGSIAVDLSDGRIHYIAWNDDSTFETDVVPGCAPFVFGASAGGFIRANERVFHARDWQGRQVVRPSVAGRAYNVRLTAAGPAGARLRCGPSDDAMQALTVQTQGPRAYETGVAAAGDAGLVIWSEGVLTEVYVDVLGALG